MDEEFWYKCESCHEVFEWPWEAGFRFHAIVCAMCHRPTYAVKHKKYITLLEYAQGVEINNGG